MWLDLIWKLNGYRGSLPGYWIDVYDAIKEADNFVSNVQAYPVAVKLFYVGAPVKRLEDFFKFAGHNAYALVGNFYHYAFFVGKQVALYGFAFRKFIGIAYYVI